MPHLRAGDSAGHSARRRRRGGAAEAAGRAALAAALALALAAAAGGAVAGESARQGAAEAGDEVAREGAEEAGERGRAVIRITLPEGDVGLPGTPGDAGTPAAAATAVAVPPAGPPAAATPGGAMGAAAPPSEAALESLLPAEASMVVLDEGTGRRVRLHGEQAARPLPPCSTFKIPNTLISLGAGAVTPEDHFLPRDRERDPRGDFWSDAWDADQDLPSALRRSTVWYYQELARRVGNEEMQRQLDRLGYGNRDISAGIDRFWLGGSLAISADEQVAFLRRLHAGDFAFPEEHLALLRQGMLQEEGGAADGPYALYAKTGACPIGDDENAWVGWWVGWIDRAEGRPALFALNLTGTSYRDIADRRIPLARAVLTELGLLPPPG